MNFAHLKKLALVQFQSIISEVEGNMNENNRNKILSWIKDTIRAENILVELVDIDTKDDNGLASVLVFAKVEGTDESNDLGVIDLVIKMGKEGTEFREKQPIMRECYKREIFFYERVIPTFHKFQLDKNVNIFSAVPRCYKTFLFDDIEVIILENMKTKGYIPHGLHIPLSLPKIKLVLENYARFHALSFALRDQNEEEWKLLTAYQFSIMKQVALTSGVFRKSDRGLENLKQTGRADLVTEYVKVINRTKEAIIVEILDDVPQEAVITHGDCHIGNFLFTNEEKDYGNPQKVAIIDWQLCEHHSPVLDLSYFLYAALSSQDISQIGELIKFYHCHLTSFLEELGSDVEKMFPYKIMIEHWKKYSIYGFIIATTFLEVYYVERENNASLEEYKRNGDLDQFLGNTKLKREDSYKQRLISIVEQFCKSILT